MTGEDMLTKLAESRRALRQAIQGLSEEEMTQVQVEGVWTIKDVLGHITTWEEFCLKPLQRYADGAPFEATVIEDYLASNEELAARKHDVPLSVILDELDAVRRELAAAAGGLSDEKWEQRVIFPWGDEGPITEMFDELHQHELEHVHTIQQWRGERAG